MKLVSRLKKRLIAAASASIFALSPVCHAADASTPTVDPQQAMMQNMMSSFSSMFGDVFQQIANNTYNTLVAVNKLPSYLESITFMAMSWLSQDIGEKSAIQNSQQSFAALGYWFTQESQAQKDMQPQIVADLLGVPLFVLKMPIMNQTFSGINDISYSTVLGNPPATAPANPYNYMRYASALNLPRPFPNRQWPGPEEAKSKYSQYYATVTAVQSYDGYILSHMVAESANNSPVAALQKELITKASNSEWIGEIATEDLGKVLRQILLFQSQSYVVLSQMLKTQKEMSQTLAMTNSMLIALNQQNESQLLQAAMTPPAA